MNLSNFTFVHVVEFYLFIKMDIGDAVRTLLQAKKNLKSDTLVLRRQLITETKTCYCYLL